VCPTTPDPSGKPVTRSSSTASTALSRANLILAAVTVCLIIGLSFVVFRPATQALKVIAGGTLASLLAVLLIYILRKTILKPVDDYAAEKLADDLGSKITDFVRSSLTDDVSVICFSKWNDIVWKTLLADTLTLEFSVSYMDTWVALTHDPLLDIFRRGGRITVYLPNPTHPSAERVQERFPEYTPELIKGKILNTGQRLQAIYLEAANSTATLEVFYTDTFIMHCLMRIDEKRILLSPFDHFRRSHIEGPAWLVESDRYKPVAQWAQKEFEGFRKSATSAVVDESSE